MHESAPSYKNPVYKKFYFSCIQDSYSYKFILAPIACRLTGCTHTGVF